MLAVVWQWRLALALPVVVPAALWLLSRWGNQLDALPGTNPANLIGRADLWGRALLAIHDFPLSGVGLGMFRRLALLYYPFFDIDPVLADVGHAHNAFLQMALDFGILGWWLTWP
ncbi:MAG: O-antigen ligase family protein [Anaerolineae bacterium]|nr:MAG: O-antigen ligase family protein [Anaerolineae bacterium]